MWRETPQGLYKKFTFKDFKEAFGFMKQVALVAESQGHHPRWVNEYNIIEIWLSTHESGGAITGKDKQLAESIDRIANANA